MKLKNYLKNAYLLAFLLACVFTNGQVSSYIFGESTGVYTPLTGATNISFGGTTTTWDENVATIPLGFNFRFNNLWYSSCSVNSNGFLTFGTSSSNTNTYSPISNSNTTIGGAYAGAVSAFGRDLINNGTAISYNTTGTAPNRIFTVQWTNARRYFGGAVTGDVLNFQIKLEENTNIIRLVYGLFTITNTTALSCQVGLRGAGNFDFNNRLHTTNGWAGNTSLGTANNNSCITRFNGGRFPASGLTFTYSPPASCSNTTVTSGLEDDNYISNVSFLGTLNDTSNTSTFSSVAPIGYKDFTGLPSIASQAQGEGVNVFVQALLSGFIKAWIDWNNDGDFLDFGELVYDTKGVATASTTFGYIIPPLQPIGNYKIRIRFNGRDFSNTNQNSNNNYGPCGLINYTGETEDYTFTVLSSCPAKITTTTEGSVCGSGTATMTAGGDPAQTYQWFTAATGGSAVGTAASFTTSSISTTTTYYVLPTLGGCDAYTRTPVKAIVNPVPTVNFTPAAPEICGENIVLSIAAAGDIEEVFLINENFEDATPLGVYTNTNIVSNGTTNDNITKWQKQNNTFVPAQQVWFPAISSGSSNNKFAMATSDLNLPNVHNALVSNILNTTNFINLNLDFKIYYSRYYQDGTSLTSDYVTVDYSLNGGTTWNEVQRYTADIGIGTRFSNLNLSLPASCLNQTNLKIRFRYYGEWCDGLALDDIKLFGNRPLNTAFNWTGSPMPDVYVDAACNTPYMTGTPATIVYIKPTLAQLNTASFTFTASAMLSNGCSASTPINVINKSRTWTGATTDWNTASNWTPAIVPDLTNCVIIPTTGTQPILNTGANALAKNLLVKTNSILEVSNNLSLTIKEAVTIEPNGTLNIKNNSNLIQIDNVPNVYTNTANFNYERIANLRREDYVYWSSPVSGFSLSNVSPLTNNGYKYHWLPTATNNNGGVGNWAYASGPMTIGKGYIVRGPSGTTNDSTTPLTVTFNGLPTNGNINVPIERGTYTGGNVLTANGSTRTNDDDNLNLIGNPYPSSINAIDFLNANSSIQGNVRIWTHGTLPQNNVINPFYNTYQSNYTVNDYIIYNKTGLSTGPSGFNGYIAAGQSFFVVMEDTAPTTDSVTFANSMRSDLPTNTAYNNSQFYRNSTPPTPEKSRIWLDLIGTNLAPTRTLIGYVPDATNNKDRMFDAVSTSQDSFSFYSLINNENFIIQGKALPFDNNDQVSLGYRNANAGNYTIAIGTVDGLFENQAIYIEDKLTNTTHNLKNSPYNFTTAAGVFDNRFVLKYINNQTILNNETFIESTNNVKAFGNTKTEVLNIQSEKINITKIEIFDVIGKKLFSKNNIDKLNLEIKEIKPTNNLLIIKVELDNGISVSKKVIY